MKIASGIGRFRDPFLTRKSDIFEEKVQKVVMGFYREERVSKSHCFELTMCDVRST